MQKKFILGIETSCDETGVAVFDPAQNRLLSSALFSQIAIHEQFGGVVPELAARSQLEKIDVVTTEALAQAHCSIDDIEAIGVTHTPGLVGSLLVGISFAKGITWTLSKKLIGVNHLEGHIFSSFLREDGGIMQDIAFPFLCMSVSGGHTSLYLVSDFGKFECIGSTTDDAAGEALDKIAQLMGLGYPGGPIIERYALQAATQDPYRYPRNKNKHTLDFSFSGLKTAVLYDLVKRGAFDLQNSTATSALTTEVQCNVASSLQSCIADIFTQRISRAFQRYPQAQGLAFVGGVANNQFIRSQLELLCKGTGKFYLSPPRKFCADNGAMIAFVASYKAARGEFADLSLDACKVPTHGVG